MRAMSSSGGRDLLTMLTEIAPPRFDVDLDLRYATADNLTGAPIYRGRWACSTPTPQSD